MTNLIPGLTSAARRCRAAAGALLLTAAAAPALAEYPPGKYSLTLTGLPSGLTVTFETALLNCLGPFVFVPSGSVRMTETLQRGVVRTETPTGPQFQLVWEPAYTGQLIPSSPFNPGPCLGADGGTHDLELSAFVQTIPDPTRQFARKVFFLPRVMLNSNLHFTQRLAARSTFGPTTLPAGQTGPITFTRNTSTTVVVDNFNAIDPADNRTPGLAILRTSGPLLNRQLARLFLNASGRPCITAAGATVCQGAAPATPSGGIVHAGIELMSIEHRRTGADVPAQSSRAVFSFKLPATFPVGTYELAANANDLDVMPYLVNGVSKTLDLLPWQSTVHPVVVQ